MITTILRYGETDWRSQLCESNNGGVLGRGYSDIAAAALILHKTSEVVETLLKRPLLARLFNRSQHFRISEYHPTAILFLENGKNVTWAFYGLSAFFGVII